MEQRQPSPTPDLASKHAEDLQRLRNFRLLDDDFMSKVFEDTACTELLLQIILDRSDLKVQSVHSQHEIKNLQGRSIRLDILATNAAGQVCNIEIQRSDKGAGVKRARYNGSLMDANLTAPGDAYEDLYHIDRVIRETGQPFGDESHIIYVNAQITNETALGRLMHDFRCTDPQEMYYGILANRVHYFKADEKGVSIMCKAMEDMRSETARETAHAKAVAIARNLLAIGKLTYEEIAQSVDLTVDEVKALDSQKTA